MRRDCGSKRTKMGEQRAARKQIVVADDHPEVADLLSELIESFGYEVRTCYDGLQAQQAIGEHWPHGALLDISMPGINGIQLARWARSQRAGAGIRLIALTGHASREDHERMRSAGFDEVLAKPLDFERLRAALDGGERS